MRIARWVFVLTAVVTAHGGLARGHSGPLAAQVPSLDWRNCRVEVFTRTGELLGRWGSCGFGPGRFGELNDVVADGSGRVYVTDYTNNCVQAFELRWK